MTLACEPPSVIARGMNGECSIRPATAADVPAISAALAYAIGWRGRGGWARSAELIEATGHAYLLAGRGRRGGEGVIAEVGGHGVGAAWYRWWSEGDNPAVRLYRRLGFEPHAMAGASLTMCRRLSSRRTKDGD